MCAATCCLAISASGWLWVRHYATRSTRYAGELPPSSTARPSRSAAWIKILTVPKEGTAVTVLEWLRDPPHRVGRRDIADYVERAQTLRELGSDQGDWADIAEARRETDVAPKACSIAPVARTTPDCRS